MYSFGLCEVDEVSLSIATNHQLSTFFVKKLSPIFLAGYFPSSLIPMASTRVLWSSTEFAVFSCPWRFEVDSMISEAGEAC